MRRAAVCSAAMPHDDIEALRRVRTSALPASAGLPIPVARTTCAIAWTSPIRSAIR